MELSDGTQTVSSAVKLQFIGATLALSGDTAILTITGGAGITPGFSNKVTDAAPGASQNNYAPTGYVGGTTNKLRVGAASGGTSLTGLSSAGVPDGFELLILNTSATDNITFVNQSGSSSAANRFFCTGAVNGSLAPYGTA